MDWIMVFLLIGLVTMIAALYLFSTKRIGGLFYILLLITAATPDIYYRFFM